MSLLKYARSLLILGFTASIVGYLSVWLPGPGAGLSLLGIEMGEWFKFAGLGGRRDIFYLPPITIGLMLAIWTMTWRHKARGAWVVRALAIMVALLAFPALADISGAAAEQYMLRAALTMLVIAVTVLSGFWRPDEKHRPILWLLMAALGVIGAVVPSWLYMVVRPFTADLFGVAVGIGFGVWLNALGQSLVAALSLGEVYVARRDAEAVAIES